MRLLSLFILGSLWACTTLIHEKGTRRTFQVTLKNTGKIDARKASFVVLKEGAAQGPVANDPKLLENLSSFAKQQGHDVQSAEDILSWASQGSDSRYLLVIQKQGLTKKPKKTCVKLQVLYFLPSDLQEATVDPSFRQEIESCDGKASTETELTQAALRTSMRHLGRDGLFLDE